ncbi:cyclase family protein [Streptacidiphilus sp. P02-A3a]|uniref:cyclase family protein n=1 Tax=Streptacidiphilus sp. P02-A3a TaxID=2704468 RepID=UPI0015F8C830|nr:cyclase family protein [Streptacidiphilus sp. P02-A3a]QMU69747.1 cyclase family protein [Streptacidiphilus sp. P02-A3a]
MTTPDSTEDLPTNWGRWGPDDELGTLNHISDAARARGVAAARMGRVVSLALPVRPAPLAGPVPFATGPQPAGVMQMMNFNGSPTRALTDVLIVNTHHGAVTHIDALAHIPLGDQVYPGVPIARAVVGGTVQHGSTTPFAAGITTRGVLLDLAPQGRLRPGHLVTGQDLDEAEQRAGVPLESGDALVVRGGWRIADHLGEPVPAMTVDAVRWMAEREVSLYAGDIGDPPPIRPSGPLAMHQVALARLGMPLIDNAEVTALAAACHELDRHSFLFVVAAAAITGATGLPVNPLAIF